MKIKPKRKTGEHVCSVFRCIVADPPWKYGAWGSASDSLTARKKFPNGQWSKNFGLEYKTMTVNEIKALPVASLAADDCDIYLWTTQKYLPDSFGVLDSWGFRYCQTLVWCKTPRGTGQGGLYCPTTEFLILGRKGKMPVKKRVETTWWNVKRTMRHSEKPEFFQEIIEAQSNGPRLELFARRKRPGWYSWGNEVESDIVMPNARDARQLPGHTAQPQNQSPTG
jgi:N6-adenosine-specific RNA methylase IME4